MMKAVMTVCAYLLIGGVLAGGVNESTRGDGEKLSDESLMFVAVAWPAVVGMALGSATYSRGAER